MTKKLSVLDKFGRRLDAAMVKYDEADPELFRATYNPDSGLYRNKAGTVAFRNEADAAQYNEAIGILPPVNNSNVVVANNEIKTENQVRKETKNEQPGLKHKNGMTTWELMKATGTGRERAEYKRYEREQEKRMNEYKVPSNMDDFYKNPPTQKQLEQMERKAHPNMNFKKDKPFNQKKPISEKSKAYADQMTKMIFETAKEAVRQDAAKVSNNNDIQIPEARTNLPITDDPKYRNTIFGSDVYWARSKGFKV